MKQLQILCFLSLCLFGVQNLSAQSVQDSLTYENYSASEELLSLLQSEKFIYRLYFDKVNHTYLRLNTVNGQVTLLYHNGMNLNTKSKVLNYPLIPDTEKSFAQRFSIYMDYSRGNYTLLIDRKTGNVYEISYNLLGNNASIKRVA